MTYKLPFGLKQKPLRRYIDGGSINFLCVNGTLMYEVTRTTKHLKFSYVIDKVIHTKEQLDKLLSITSIHEIPTIEEVVS